jgi:hypothetical protein
MPATDCVVPTPPTVLPRTRGQAFGIAVDAPVALPLGAVANGATSSRRTTLGLTSRADVDRTWRNRETTWLLKTRYEGRLLLGVEHEPELGYRIYAPRYGRHHVSPDGRSISSVLPNVAPWRWQRLLFAQAIPLAATLQGVESLHASAVQLDGGAFCFTAISGTGKTSLALHLVARGATLMTDDVLAVEPSASGILAHPGAATLSVDPAELAAVPDEGRGLVGEVVGRIDNVQLRPSVARRPYPLRAMYFLERSRAIGRVRIEPLRPDPALLLATTFIPYVTSAERLETQLDVCSRVASSVPLFRIESPRNRSALDVAEAVEHHAEALS